MNSSLKRIGQTALALALAALALPSAGISGAQAAPKPDLTTAAQMALHFQHEDALYRAKDTSPGMGSSAEAIALHFKHEDAFYRAQRSASSQVRSTLRPEAAGGDGFDWTDALVGAGSAVALMLLTASAIVGVRRGRGRLVQS